MKQDIINITWKPLNGKMYRVVNSSGHYLSLEPKAKYFYTRNLKTEDIRLNLQKNDIFMFLGQIQRIPEYYSFFKILHKDLVCWLILSERLYEKNHVVYDPILLF